MSDLKIKFVAVELLKKGCSTGISVEYGLFKGIRSRSDGDASSPKVVSYVLIEKNGEEDSIHAFNLNDYNILSISSRCNNIKELVVYKEAVDDQKKAAKLLYIFLNALRKGNRMVKNDAEIIDIKTYTDLPSTIKKLSPTGAAGNKHNAYIGCRHNLNNTNDWQKKKEEREKEESRQEALRKIPTVFKREGEAPGVKALNLMKKKIQLIATGDYESDVIEKEEEEDETTKNFPGHVGFVG
jgi:hypothetical protein